VATSRQRIVVGEITGKAAFGGPMSGDPIIFMRGGRKTGVKQIAL
jgi:hypothetical protein